MEKEEEAKAEKEKGMDEAEEPENLLMANVERAERPGIWHGTVTAVKTRPIHSSKTSKPQRQRTKLLSNSPNSPYTPLLAHHPKIKLYTNPQGKIRKGATIVVIKVTK
jgi:hypothetical protein